MWVPLISQDMATWGPPSGIWLGPRLMPIATAREAFSWAFESAPERRFAARQNRESKSEVRRYIYATKVPARKRLRVRLYWERI